MIQDATPEKPGGVQGLKWYQAALRQDADGDLAHEFLQEAGAGAAGAGAAGAAGAGSSGTTAKKQRQRQKRQGGPAARSQTLQVVEARPGGRAATGQLVVERGELSFSPPRGASRKRPAA